MLSRQILIVNHHRPFFHFLIIRYLVCDIINIVIKDAFKNSKTARSPLL